MSELGFCEIKGFWDNRTRICASGLLKDDKIVVLYLKNVASYPHWEMICYKTSKQGWEEVFTLFEQAKACEFVNPNR